MSTSREIIDLLEARASSGRAAFEIVQTVFVKIFAALRRDPRFAGISLLELELLIADPSRELEDTLFAALRDRVHLDDAEDAVRLCLGDEQ